MIFDSGSVKLCCAFGLGTADPPAAATRSATWSSSSPRARPLTSASCSARARACSSRAALASRRRPTSFRGAPIRPVVHHRAWFYQTSCPHTCRWLRPQPSPSGPKLIGRGRQVAPCRGPRVLHGRATAFTRITGLAWATTARSSCAVGRVHVGTGFQGFPCVRNGHAGAPVHLDVRVSPALPGSGRCTRESPFTGPSCAGVVRSASA